MLLYRRLKLVASRCEDVPKERNTRDHLAWTIGNGDPMHEVYPTQDTSRMKTARVKQEEDADTGIIVKVWYEIRKEGTCTL